MVDSVGVEPTSHRLRAEYNASIRQVYLFGGTSRTRTDHLLLAKQALSQMSYGPIKLVRVARFELAISPPQTE